MATSATCPACLSPHGSAFYRLEQIPVHSTLLMKSAPEADAIPRRDLELAVCPDCGFIYNRLFEPGLHDYSPACEESQGCSPTFNRWLASIVDLLVSRWDVAGRTVLEIGCGKGEFLASLCLRGNNHGIGYDPAYIPGRLDPAAEALLRFHRRMWHPACGIHDAEVICCRHTLEHIPDVHGFMAGLRAGIGEATQTLLFFELPDTGRILEQGAFEDIYYEHCSYFTQESLQALFERTGFEVLSLWRDYQGQYLMLVARPATAENVANAPDPVNTLAEVARFEATVKREIREWKEKVAAMDTEGRIGAVWGGGSKAVAFLHAADPGRRIPVVVDINPHKQHAFMPGSAQQVVSPEELALRNPDDVIVLNSAYREEISRQLAALDCHPRLLVLH